MHTGIVTAAAIHNLALAVAYGGTIFGRVALRRAALQGVSNDQDRAKVLSVGWTEFNKINVPAHLAFTATWAIERRALNKGYLTSERTQRLVAIKDVLVTGALVTGVANVIAGEMMKRDLREGISVSNTGAVTGENAVKVDRYVRFFQVMGPLNTALIGASIAIGPAIAASAIRGAQRGVLSRLLGGMIGRR